METLEGLEQAKGERGQRKVLYTPLASSSLPLGYSSMSLPLTPSGQPPPFYPFHPHLWAHILGVKGIVAATAELVAALGAVKVHAASSGQCVGELALGAICKEQRVRSGAVAAPQGPQEERHWQ